MNRGLKRNLLIATLLLIFIMLMFASATAASNPQPKYIFYQVEENDTLVWVRADYMQAVDDLLDDDSTLRDAIAEAILNAIGAGRNVYVEDEDGNVINYTKANRDNVRYPDAADDFDEYGVEAAPEAEKELVVDPDTGDAVLRPITEILEVASVEDLDDITVDYGTDFTDVPLPEEVEVTFDDDSTSMLSVEWDEGDYDAHTPDTYSLEGELDLPNYVVNPDELVAEVDVTVLDVEEGLTGFVFEWAEVDGVYEDVPVAGATVTDGVNTTTTSAEGFYKLESSTGFKTVTASQEGYFDGSISEDPGWNERIEVTSNRSTAANIIYLEPMVRCELFIEGRLEDDLTGDDVEGAMIRLQEYCEDEEEWVNISGRQELPGDNTFGFYNEDAEALASDWVHDDNKFVFGLPCTGWDPCPIQADSEYRVVVEKNFWEPNPFDDGLVNPHDAMEPLVYEFTTSASERQTYLGVLGMRAIDSLEEITLNVSWAADANDPGVTVDDRERIWVTVLAPDGETIIFEDSLSRLLDNRSATYEWTVTPPLTAPSGTYYAVVEDDSGNAIRAHAFDVEKGADIEENITIDAPVIVEVKNILDEWSEDSTGKPVDNIFYQQVGDQWVWTGSETVLFDVTGEAEYTNDRAPLNETVMAVAGGDYIFEESSAAREVNSPYQTLVIDGLIAGGFLQFCIEDPTAPCLKDVEVVLLDSAGEEVERRSWDILNRDDYVDPYREIPFGTVLQDDDYTLELYVDGALYGESDPFDITEWVTVCILIELIPDPPIDLGDLSGVVRDATDGARIDDGTAALYHADVPRWDSYVGHVDIGNGDYDFAGLELRDYWLVFRVPGEYETKAVRVTVSAGDNYRSVELTPGGDGRFRLTVRDQFMDLLTSADIGITIRDQFDDPASGVQIPGARYLTGDLDEYADGEFRVEPRTISASVEYDVSVFGPGFVTQYELRQQLPSIGASERLDFIMPYSIFELEPGVPVWDLNIYPGTWPFLDQASTVIAIYDSEGNLQATYVNPTSPFTVQLPDGEYRVEVYQSGFYLRGKDVTIDGNHENLYIAIEHPILHW